MSTVRYSMLLYVSQQFVIRSPIVTTSNSDGNGNAAHPSATVPAVKHFIVLMIRMHSAIAEQRFFRLIAMIILIYDLNEQHMATSSHYQ
jgi:hypothetical protein